MKKNTLFLIVGFLVSMTLQAQEYETCVADPNQIYYTTNAGWTQSEWYPIIDIDAEKLTVDATGMSAHSGADGSATSSTFSSGVFTTPIYTFNEEAEIVPAGLNWPVQYYMACVAPDFYNSAYSKDAFTGGKISGSAPCYLNDNSVIQSPIWEKQGFIELSRQGQADGVSRHGYIILPDLPAVERVQWSFSSTGWKRGFKLDIKRNDGDWEPLHWEGSDITPGIAGFAEQGYAFEEIIGQEENSDYKISLRWTIWDGDSIHENITKTDGSTYTATHDPLGQKQVVRVHQIKVFSGVVPEEAPSKVTQSYADNLSAFYNGQSIVVSQHADIEMYSAEGRLIYQGRGNVISANQFNQGIYILKMTDYDGRVSRQMIRL